MRLVETHRREGRGPLVADETDGFAERTAPGVPDRAPNHLCQLAQDVRPMPTRRHDRPHPDPAAPPPLARIQADPRVFTILNPCHDATASLGVPAVDDAVRHIAEQLSLLAPPDS
jgi:hypothetical protein